MLEKPKPSGRGGRRPGAGRPRKENARTRTLSIAVSDAELSAVRLAGGSAWARRVLLGALTAQAEV